MEKILCKIVFDYDEEGFLSYETEVLEEGIPNFELVDDPMSSRGGSDDMLVLSTVHYTTRYDFRNGFVSISVDASEIKNGNLYAVLQTETEEKRQQFTQVHRGVSEVLFTDIDESFQIYIIEK